MLVPKEKINQAKELYGDKAMSDIVSYFGLEGSYNEISKSCSCPWHKDNTPSFIWNPKNNCAHCFSCNRNFGILDLYLAQGMSYLEAVEKLFKQVDMDFNFVNKGIQNASYKYPKREHSDRANVEKYLNLRGISKKTLDYADVQSDINGNVAFHYYNSDDVLMTVKYRLGRKFNKEKDHAKCWSQKNADFTPLLFNMNRVDPTKPLLVVEGEVDCLSVIEAGYANVVSIPNGCANTQWVQYNWEWLEQFDKIILWFDNDEPGIKGRNDVLYRLGTWRTYYIEIPPTETTESGRKIKDANELLYFKGKDRVLYYINKPMEIPVEKVLDLSKAEDFDIEHTEGLYTGIKDLDDQIYKLTFGTLNIITGRSGCVDCDTEYFNGTQWIKISDYVDGDKVLQYNIDGTASLVNPIQYHKYKENSLWHLKTKYGLDMCVSDEHNVCYVTSKGNICIKPFEDFRLIHDRSVNGHQGKFITSFNYGGYGIDLNDDEIKLMLAVICDGSFDKRIQSNGCRINLKKDRKKIELEKILNNLGIKYSKNNGMDNYSCYTFKAPLRTKEFTKEWYNCNHHQLSIIVNNIFKWDGDIKKTSWRYFTTNKKNADFIQFAASACGYKATLNIRDRRGRTKLSSKKEYVTKSIDYIICATTRNLVGINVDGKKNKKTEIVPYKTLDGYKYCFTVPSHMWIMRRNGKICITGNSGKSCFVNQIALCQSLQQGYDAFVFSGELPAPILRNWVETTMIGRDGITMKDNHIRVFDPSKRAKMQNWYSGRILVYDNDEDMTATSIINKMEELARKCGTKVFLIDNLMMVDLECNEEGRLQAEKNFVGKLINFAKKYNVLVFLVAHPRKTKDTGSRVTQEDIAGSGNIVNLAHMVFSVHRYTAKEKEGEINLRGDYIKGKEPINYDVSIEVLKNRITGILPTVDMYFDYPSYRFYKNPSELWFRYNWNKDTSPLRTDDPNNHGEMKSEVSPL